MDAASAAFVEHPGNNNGVEVNPHVGLRGDAPEGGMMRWKVIEEQRWVDWATRDENRLQTLEQIALIAVFLGGFAVSDLSNFNKDDFTAPWGEIYLCLMANVVGCTTFLAVVGILTISAVHRGSEWDRTLERWIEDTHFTSYRQAREALKTCPTYSNAVHQLWRLAIFNTERRTTYKAEHLERDNDLGLPFSTRTMNIMSDFNLTPLGFARAAFPSAIFCYLVAVAIKFTQRFNTYATLVAPAMLLVWACMTAYYSRTLLNIVGHAGEGSWVHGHLRVNPQCD